MFQFTTTTIINSRLDSNGVTPKFSKNGANDIFNVTRVNSFKKDNIVSVYKRAYSAGVNEVAKVTLPDVAATKGQVIRLEVWVKLTQNHADSEYGSIYHWFQKPTVVECIASGSSTTDATNLTNQLNKLKDKYGIKYFNASASGADITLTAQNDYQRFDSAVVSVEDGSSPNTIVEPAYKDITKSFTIVTMGKEGFGDELHMIRSIMLPTYENSRFFGINKEERPILGGNYSEFVIRYQVDKHIDDGIQSGGVSITTHVFYVKSDLVAEFEAALVAVKALSSIVASATDVALSLSTDQNELITTSNTLGAITYVSSNPAIATVNSAGLITAVGIGSASITVTDASGNSSVVVLTVVA